MTTRRNFLYTGALAGVAGLTIGAGRCSSGSVVTQIGIVISAFDQSLPIFRDLLPNSVVLVTKALAIAKDLKKALEAKSPDALGFLRQLIAPDGLFNQIIDTLNLISDVGQRRIVSGILLLANIALSVIAAQLEQVSTAATRSAARGANASAAAAVEGLGQSGKLEQLLKAARF